MTQRRFWGCAGYPHCDGVLDQASDGREMKRLMSQLTEEVRALKIGTAWEVEESSPADRKEAQAYQKKQMYESQLVKGRFRRSRRANPSGTAQSECSHDVRGVGMGREWTRRVCALFGVPAPECGLLRSGPRQAYLHDGALWRAELGERPCDVRPRSSFGGLGLQDLRWGLDMALQVPRVAPSARL